MRLIKLTCPKCGSTLPFSGGGKSVTCQYCDCNFLLENELGDRLKRAFQLIAQSNYTQAKELLDDASVIDNQNGQIYFAMLLCDLTVNSPSKLTKVGFDFTRMPNYQNALMYLDPSSKAELEQCAALNKQYMNS